MGLLSSLFRKVATSGYIKDANRQLPIYRSLGPLELVDAKVSTAVALAFIIEDSKSQSSGGAQDALQCLLKDLPLDEKAGGYLSLYLLRLMSLQKEANGRSSPINKMIASGIPAWIISFRGLISVEMMPYARELWSILDRADDSLYSRKISDIQHFLGDHPLGQTLSQPELLNRPLALTAR